MATNEKKKTRIGINLVPLRPGRIGGMENYVRKLVDNSLDMFSDIELVLFCNNDAINTFIDKENLEKHQLDPPYFQDWKYNAFAEFSLDVWFCPLLTLEPYKCPLPSAITMPDLQHVTYPQFFSEKALKWRDTHYGRSVKHADLVFAISDHANKQISEFYNTDKVVTTLLDTAYDTEYRESDFVNAQEFRKQHDIGDNYLFYPANSWPHKNHINLFRALKVIKDIAGDCPELVLTGQTRPSVELEKALDPIIDHVKFLDMIPHSKMPYLYKGAAALVFPSLYEGFGMPVVEAMRLGCPVLCSDRTSLPEIGGGAVKYFDPVSPYSIAKTITDLLNSDAMRVDLIKKGWKRSKMFSWERCAHETITHLKGLVGTKENITFAETLPEKKIWSLAE